MKFLDLQKDKKSIVKVICHMHYAIIIQEHYNEFQFSFQLVKIMQNRKAKLHFHKIHLVTIPRFYGFMGCIKTS